MANLNSNQLRRLIEDDGRTREELFQYHLRINTWSAYLSTEEARRDFETNLVNRTPQSQVWVNIFLPEYNRTHRNPRSAGIAAGGGSGLEGILNILAKPRVGGALATGVVIAGLATVLKFVAPDIDNESLKNITEAASTGAYLAAPVATAYKLLKR